MLSVIKSKYYWIYSTFVVIYVVGIYFFEGCYRLASNARGACGLVEAMLNYPAFFVFQVFFNLINRINFFFTGKYYQLILSDIVIIVILIFGWLFIGLFVGYIFRLVIVSSDARLKKSLAFIVSIILFVLSIILINRLYFGVFVGSIVLRNNSNSVPTIFNPQLENEIIGKLLSSWKITQSKFIAKAGESGVYNHPSKIQFISPDTMIINYDDGLVDHISVIRYQNGEFTELKLVSTISKMTTEEWQAIFHTYGTENYQISSYVTNDYDSYVKTSNDI